MESELFELNPSGIDDDEVIDDVGIIEWWWYIEADKRLYDDEYIWSSELLLQFEKMIKIQIENYRASIWARWCDWDENRENLLEQNPNYVNSKANSKRENHYENENCTRVIELINKWLCFQRINEPRANGKGRCADASSQYLSHVRYQQIALFISSEMELDTWMNVC